MYMHMYMHMYMLYMWLCAYGPGVWAPICISRIWHCGLRSGRARERSVSLCLIL